MISTSPTGHLYLNATSIDLHQIKTDMTETKLTGLISKLEGVLDELKQQAKIIASEDTGETDGANSDPKYILLHSGRILGGEKLLSKRGLFKAIVANEAGKYTLGELNEIFPNDKISYPHNLIGDETFVKSLPKSYHEVKERYIETGARSKDGFELRALGEWKEWNDTAKSVPGNFPALREVAQKLGYHIIELN